MCHKQLKKKIFTNSKVNVSFIYIYLCFKVMLRMISYLQKVHHYTETRSLLELQHLIEPDNIDTIMQLGRYYMLYQMDLSDLMVKLTEIQVHK